MTGIMKLNQDYVLSQVAYSSTGKKRDPEALEELNKQLKYMEDLITLLKVNTTKNETRTRSDIKLKTKENTQLIIDLNNLKYESKKQQNMQERKHQELLGINEEIKALKRKEAALRHEFNGMTQQRAAEPEEGDKPEEEDKGRRPTTSKARLVAEQAREDEQDKAEIARLMVSAAKYALTAVPETLGGEQQEHGGKHEGNTAHQEPDSEDHSGKADLDCAV